MLNETPRSERIHISLFGKINVGKSSLINAITNQEISVVSDIKGTTTDPVYKSMELSTLGSTVIVDTPGYDDKSELRNQRLEKTKQVLNKTDIALLVCDAREKIGTTEERFISCFEEKKIPYIIVYNKCDLADKVSDLKKNEICVSAQNKIGIERLKTLIGEVFSPSKERKIIGDFLSPNDIVVLVTPIDAASPKGRLILPQQQTIRDALDSNAVCIVAQETELKEILSVLGNKIKLVVCDSRVFKTVNEVVPPEIFLTSFSILFTRYKGSLKTALDGINKLDFLSDGDTILISEGCTHHRQCGDIGTEKIPLWIENYTKKHLKFEFTSGTDFPTNLNKYSLIIHCGGCMLSKREMNNRNRAAATQAVPITNYGILIAKINGILDRSCDLLKTYHK